MKVHRLLLGAVFVALFTPVVYAGGMLTYDPAVYQEIAALFAQVKELYKLTKDQLNKIAEVEKTIREAQQSYNTIVNTDLHGLASEFVPGKYLGGSGNTDKINALRLELESLESTAKGNKDYYEYQLGRLKNLERLNFLQEASAGNLETASENVDVRTSGQITAQSTTTMAALATLAEEQRQKENISAAKAAEKERSDFFESADVYEAIGGKR